MTIVMLAFGGSWITSSANSSISRIDNGWSIFREGKSVHNVALSEYNIGKCQRGDSISLSQTFYIPAKSTLMFKTNMQAIDIIVDGKIKYSYGRNELEKGKLIPKRYNLFDMNPEGGRHNIMIIYTMGETGTLNYFSPIYIGPRSLLMRAFFSYNRISMFVGSFLIVYACVMCTLAVYLALTKRKTLQMYISGIFSMILGCYILARNDIFWFLGSYDELFSMMEYIDFYLMPLAFSILLYYIHSDLIHKRLRILITINILIPMILIFLHFTGIMHINKMENAVGVLVILEIISILPSLFRGIVDNQKNEEADYYSLDADFYLLFGFIIFLIFSLLEMLVGSIYNTDVDLTDKSLFPSIDLLEFGMLYFTLCYFVYYFMNGINHMSADRVRKQLEGMAYTDTLTGLLNRAAYNQRSANLSGDYTVISLDLDNLKYVNDTYGHLAGDRMIIAFAKLLEEVYVNADIIARTGGDEFVVVSKRIDCESCEACIQKLQDAMDKFNEYSNDITLSASVGYATSREVDSNKYQDVFSVADLRMYKMKEVHHG
jgi:diguanylate cyclase (GGDEF)-like protein